MDKEIVITRLRCNRCGYSWLPRSLKVPKRCPNHKCGSPYWNRKRVYKIKKKEVKK